MRACDIMQSCPTHLGPAQHFYHCHDLLMTVICHNSSDDVMWNLSHQVSTQSPDIRQTSSSFLDQTLYFGLGPDWGARPHSLAVECPENISIFGLLSSPGQHYDHGREQLVMGKHDPSLHFRSEVRWRLPDVTKQQLVVRWPRQPIFVNKHLSLSPACPHMSPLSLTSPTCSWWRRRDLHSRPLLGLTTEGRGMVEGVELVC